jgi:hypothetical protein
MMTKNQNPTKTDDKPDANKPIRRGWPGGYIGAIYNKLSRRQKNEIDCVLRKRNQLIKKEMKSQINAFVSRLSSELQVNSYL